MTDKEMVKRIEAEAEKFVQNLTFRESEHVTVLSPIQYFIAGAKSERNQVLDEAIDRIPKEWNNYATLNDIIRTLESLKL